MFSGIVESMGRLVSVEKKQENYDFTFFALLLPN